MQILSGGKYVSPHKYILYGILIGTFFHVSSETIISNFIMLISLPGDPPSIVLNPKRQVSLPEELVTFCVEAKGTGPLQYRWFCDNKVMEEAEGPVLTLTGEAP